MGNNASGTLGFGFQLGEGCPDVWDFLKQHYPDLQLEMQGSCEWEENFMLVVYQPTRLNCSDQEVPLSLDQFSSSNDGLQLLQLAQQALKDNGYPVEDKIGWYLIVSYG